MGFNEAYVSSGYGRPTADEPCTAQAGVEVTRCYDDALLRRCYSNMFWSSPIAGQSNAQGRELTIACQQVSHLVTAAGSASLKNGLGRTRCSVHMCRDAAIRGVIALTFRASRPMAPTSTRKSPK
jgi:hypothetical protein